MEFKVLTTAMNREKKFGTFFGDDLPICSVHVCAKDSIFSRISPEYHLHLLRVRYTNSSSSVFYEYLEGMCDLLFLFSFFKSSTKYIE